MNREFLHYYNKELQHLREMAGEFGRENPKIAGRLAIDQDGKEECPDPFVERLLEGFAFLAARIHMKLDAEFPRFTQSLLETVYPSYLCPTPSMAVVKFEPDPQETGLASGYTIPRETSLRSVIGPREKTACIYRTAHDVTLWPFRIMEAHYYTRDIGELELPTSIRAKGALKIRLNTVSGLKVNEVKANRLVFFIHCADAQADLLYEQIFAQKAALVIQSVARPVKQLAVLSPEMINRVGFDDKEALLPVSPRGFEGYRLLREYFSFPQRFLFFELLGLDQGIRLCDAEEVDLVIPFKDQEIRLEGVINAESLELYCVPAINLFPKETDRIMLTDRFSEFHVVPDRTRSLDFEVYEIETVTGYGVRSGEEQEFRPFCKARDVDTGSSAYYSINRIPRTITAQEKKFGKISDYTGTEVYISLVDASAAPYSTDLRQLGIKALCTNRHLPRQMTVGAGNTDFNLDINAPVISTRCLSGPTPPLPSYAEGEIAWRIISHLSLNYLSLLDKGEEGAVAIREMFKLYADVNNPQIRKKIDEGVRSIQSAPIIRRVDAIGPIAFGRGLEISIMFNEHAFEGTGVFVFGSVLEVFFAKYVTLNSFVETVIRTEQRGEIMRWPVRVGTTQII